MLRLVALESDRRGKPLAGILCLAAALVLLVACESRSTAAGEPPATGNFGVRNFGATGNGQALDTAAINQAVEVCAAAGGGRVVFPPGRYLSGTVHLKSRVEFFLEAGATLVGATNLDLYDTFTLTNRSPCLHTSRWHRGLILAENAEDITIAGRGVIDGSHVFDPRGEEKMRGPHTVLLGHCRNFQIRDVTISNAANYAVLFFFTDQVDVRRVTFAGGWDGVHFRGSPERWCHDVQITDCRFFTGDDSIAGSYWRNTVISNCVINSSCNGIRLIGPAEDTAITHCEFFGPGRHEHRTSRDAHRTNMLAGICLQPSAWEPMPGPMDNIRITDIMMKNVTTPFHIVTRAGNSAGRLLIERVTATGAYRAACSVECWGERTFDSVVFRDVNLGFTGGGTAEQAGKVVKPPGVDARALPAWGFYARNVRNLTLENVRLNCAQEDLRPALLADGVGRLKLDRFNFTPFASVPKPLVFANGTRVEMQERK